MISIAGFLDKSTSNEFKTNFTMFGEKIPPKQKEETIKFRK